MPEIKLSVAVDNWCRIYSRSTSSFDYWAKVSSGGSGSSFSTVVTKNSSLVPAPTVAPGPIATLTWNCPAMPSHIYIVCWSDHKTRQALYAQVEAPGGTTILSGDSAWEVYVQGSPSNSVKGDPLTAMVMSWTGAYRSLSSSEVLSATDAPTLGLPPGKWMWALNASPYVPHIKSSFPSRPPFTPGANHGDYIVFRVALPKLAVTQMEIEIRDNFIVAQPASESASLQSSLVNNDTSKFDDIADQVNIHGFRYVFVDTYTSIEAPSGQDPSAYNERLSKNRAMVVQAYLRSKITNPDVTIVPAWHGGAPSTDITAYIPGIPPTDPRNRRVTVRLCYTP